MASNAGHLDGLQVPRRPTLQELIDADRERNAPENYVVQRRRAAPGIGLLCRTLIRGSMVKQIIPTRLRNQDTCELLFIAENHIYLKEVAPDPHLDYRLRHIATISIAPFHIRSAALIGQYVKPPRSQNDSPFPNAIKIESPVRNAEPDNFPLQIIVLALTSGELRLLCYDRGSMDNEARFKLKTIPLPMDKAFALEHGKRISVDPFSRAFAVTAAFDSLIVYSLWKSSVLINRIEKDPDNWNPIHQEKIFKIHGCIIGVEFLNPGPKHSDWVVMIVVTASKRRGGLWCLAWDHSEGPHNYKILLDNRPLKLDSDSLCNLIIPMSHSPDFLLVHGATVNLYKDILTGSPKVLNVINKKSNWEREPKYSGSSRRRPHFTSWTRTERDPNWKEEWIYLIREDGIIRHYHQGRGQLGGTIGNAGEFSCSVDTAVTSFSPSSSGPDYLVAAGDMSYGELTSVGIKSLSDEPMDRESAMRLRPQAHLADWAPMMDMQFITCNSSTSRPKIMMTCGRQPHGALGELRIGFEAMTYLSADISDGDVIGAYGMWALADPISGGTHFICAYPGTTMVVYMGPDESFAASDILFDAEKSTVFAATTATGGVVLVTESQISVQAFRQDEEMEVERAIHETDSQIIAANYCALESVIVVATRNANQSTISAFRHDTTNREIVSFSYPHNVVDDITALAVVAREGTVYALIANRDGQLHLLSVKENAPILVQAQFQIDDFGQLGVAVPHSIVALPSDEDAGWFQVLCGMRDGQLISVGVAQRETREQPLSALSSLSGLNFCNAAYYRVGSGPVQLSADSTSTKRVFALCDEDTVSIEIVPGNRAEISLRFTSIWFTDDADASLPQPALSAIRVLQTPHDHDSIIACHDGTNLRLATLTCEKRPVPRRLPLRKLTRPIDPDLPTKDVSGTPTKLLYSTKLDASIIGGLRYEHRPKDKIPEPSWQGKRVTRGFLQIIPSQANANISANEESWNNKATNIDLAPTERVLSIVEWTFPRGKDRFHYLLVGTSMENGEISMIEGKKQKVRVGRLWFLAPKKEWDGSIRCDLKSIKNISRPVRALAVLDETNVVVCIDGACAVYGFCEKFKWIQKCSIPLPSLAVHVTTKSPFVYISTARSSIQAYEVKDVESDTGPMTLDPFFNDEIGRKGLVHLAVGVGEPATQASKEPSQSQGVEGEELNILLASEKDGAIHGLEIPKYKTYQSFAPTLFEARLPQCVVKFCQGAFAAPWSVAEKPARGILTNDILGAATDGTLYHFSIVSNEARLLLKFLENLVRWYEGEMERLERMKGHHQPGDLDFPGGQSVVIDPEVMVSLSLGERRRRDGYGIDADMLEPFLESSGRAKLMDMLTLEEHVGEEDEDGTKRYVGNERGERRKKFIKLVGQEVGNATDVDNAVERCVDWLGEVLRPVL